jgi:hypothetical protein
MSQVFEIAAQISTQGVLAESSFIMRRRAILQSFRGFGGAPEIG